MTVALERNALAKVSGRPTLRRREQWGSSFSYTGRWTARVPANQVFIHITVTNPRNYGSNDAHARGVEAIGRSRFPNTGGSYNRLIMGNAALYELQPMYRQGAHTVNDHRRARCNRWGSACPGNGQSLEAPSWNNNVTARAYALAMNVGNTVSDALVENLAKQIAADHLAGLLTLNAARYPHGHRCVSSKDCPGSRMWAKMKLLQTRIIHHINTRLGGAKRSWFDMATRKDLDNAIAAQVPAIARAVWRYYITHPSGGNDMFAQTYLRFAWRGAAQSWSMLPKVDEGVKAILAAQQGLDTSAIIAMLEANHDEMKTMVQEAEERWGERMDDLRNIVADVESGGATAEDALGQMGAILTDLFGEHNVPEDEEEG